MTEKRKAQLKRAYLTGIISEKEYNEWMKKEK